MNLSKIKRVYVHIDLWEEIKFNMWGNSENSEELLKSAIEFTGNHTLYGSFMMRVISEWPNSCLNSLTDSSINKKSWIGHAATALALLCPEHITRKAWSFLNYEQQFLANKKAEFAIKTWEFNYRKNNPLYQNLEETMLF